MMSGESNITLAFENFEIIPPIELSSSWMLNSLDDKLIILQTKLFAFFRISNFFSSKNNPDIFLRICPDVFTNVADSAILYQSVFDCTITKLEITLILENLSYILEIAITSSIPSSRYYLDKTKKLSGIMLLPLQ